LHSEDPWTSLFAEYLSGSETALGLVGSKLDRNLAAYAMRSFNDADDNRFGVDCSARFRSLRADRAW
jgi:hypothetical protein